MWEKSENIQIIINTKITGRLFSPFCGPFNAYVKFFLSFSGLKRTSREKNRVSVGDGREREEGWGKVGGEIKGKIAAKRKGPRPRKRRSKREKRNCLRKGTKNNCEKGEHKGVKI